MVKPVPLIVAAAAASLAGRASACSCVPPPAPQEAMKTAAAVFEGTVTAVDRKGETLTVTLTARRAWKGIDAPEVTVQTAGDGAMCGVTFEKGKSYLVYTHPRDDPKSPLRTGLCTRTTHVEQAKEDLAALGEGKPIQKKK
jgi:hypothetical protein